MTPERKRIGNIKRWLELEFPPPGPVRLWVGQMPKEYRDCLGTYHPAEDGQPAMIRLAKGQPISQLIDTLAHEWSHAIVDADGTGAERLNGGHTISKFYPQLGRIEIALQAALAGVLKTRE